MSTATPAQAGLRQVAWPPGPLGSVLVQERRCRLLARAGRPVLVQGFGEEFGSHLGRSCPLPRELPFHKLIDWDATAGRSAYHLAYADKQPDWTYPS